jgi:iron complex transport system substrate-binding protein
VGGAAATPASAAAPARIVSTAPSVTEILFALGLGERVVGVTRFCDYPEAAQALPKVGGFADLSLEAILALRPDLVVGARNGTVRPVVEKLGALGVKTLFPPDTTLPEIFRAIREIGEAAGAPLQGAELATSLEGRIEGIRKKTAARPRPKTLVVVGWRPIIVAAPGSFLDTLLSYAGGENAAEAGVSPYPTYDLEAILTRAPEVIIDASMEGSGEAEIRARWAAYPTLPAVRDGRVYAAPSAALLRPGPRLADGLLALAKTLHPGLE